MAINVGLQIQPKLPRVKHRNSVAQSAKLFAESDNSITALENSHHVEMVN